jgi:hypothetical protein
MTSSNFLSVGLYNGNETVALDLAFYALDDAQNAVEYETQQKSKKIDLAMLAFVNLHKCLKSDKYQKPLDGIAQEFDCLDHHGDLLTKDELVRSLMAVRDELTAIKRDFDTQVGM